MHEGGLLPCPVVTTTGRDVVGVAQHGSHQQQKLYDGFPKLIAVYGSLKGSPKETLLVAGRCAWIKIRRKSRVRHARHDPCPLRSAEDHAHGGTVGVVHAAEEPFAKQPPSTTTTWAFWTACGKEKKVGWTQCRKRHPCGLKTLALARGSRQEGCATRR